MSREERLDGPSIVPSLPDHFLAFMPAKHFVPTRSPRRRSLNGDHCAVLFQAIGRGQHLDRPFSAPLRSHDQKCQAIERLAMIGPERLISCGIAIVHSSNLSGSAQVEANQVVSQGTEIPILVLDAHANVRKVVAVAENRSSIWREPHLRGSSRRVHFFNGYYFPVIVVCHSLQRPGLVGNLPDPPVLSDKLTRSDSVLRDGHLP